MMMTRRDCLIAGGAAFGLAAASAQQKPTTKIGVELGCISASRFTPYQYLDYFHKVGIDAAQFNAGTLGIKEADPDEAELRKIRAYAENLGVSLMAYSGRSICPTSTSFDARQGTAEQQIAQGLRVAKIIGAKCMRVVLGSFKDRPEIERHLDSMTKVIKNVRSQVHDSGIKLALENHNADLQAREIKALIEEVGFDTLGVCLDSGNPLAIMEDPHLTLELLGPYALTSHVRDTAVWRVPEGVALRWCNMGEGNVDIDGWVKKFVKMQPSLPVSFENLPQPTPRIVPIFAADDLRYFPKMPAQDLARYLALAERGKPLPNATPVPANRRGDQQREDLEVCIRYTRKLLSATV
jgi:sugar phosphate isomerase/epimerase